jgi:lauroyl/myristoyl acyltransferase
MIRAASSIRRELRECAVLPAAAILLPWPLAFRAFRALARRAYAFAPEAERACAACAAQGLVGEPQAWSRAQRLTRIVDHVDPALSFFRSDRWLDRHATIEGDPLPAGACLFVGFHYGTAFWTLRDLARRGRRVSFLAAHVTARELPGQRLRLAFMRFRKRCVERAGKAPVILVGGSRERIAQALRDGTSVVGLIDVPDVKEGSPVTLLGRALRWPDGLLRIADAEGVPVVAFVATLDPGTGARHIRYARMPAERAPALAALAALLDDALRRDAAGWHLWAEWPRFATPHAVAQAAGTEAGVR